MEDIYKNIEHILKTSAKKHGLTVKKGIENSEAKVPKTQLHLYGRHEVVIGKRPKQKTYIVGVMHNKGYVGFYSMAVYAFPQEFDLSSTMKRTLKGKSCFHVKTWDKDIEREVKGIVEKNISLFKKEGWL